MAEKRITLESWA
ncbi:hypothetical protein AYI69_g824, partial [Smittium culicis]